MLAGRPAGRPAVIIAALLSLFILGGVYYELASGDPYHSFRKSLSRNKHADSQANSDQYYDEVYAHKSNSSHQGHEPVDARMTNVRNATLGFGKIFVASMKSRSDRRDALALAAAGTGMEVTFMDGVRRQDIPDKAFPPLKGLMAAGVLPDGAIGAWRTHANILREIVQSGIGSALVFEEDADWDVRIKDSLEQVAQATRALIQPLENDRSASTAMNNTIADSLGDTSTRYADPTYPHAELDVRPEPMVLGDLPKTKQPHNSPYGDGWDMIHIGHCGVVSPSYPDPHFDEELSRRTPKGHVMIEDDPTVPEPHYIHHVDEVHYPSFKQYREGVNHTRVVHHSMKFICSHGFAISQAGARRLLHYVGVRALDWPFDKMIEVYCQDPALRFKRGACLGVQPAMIAQYRPPGDISKDFEIESSWFADHKGHEREKGFDDNIRYSAMINIEKLVDEDTDYEDQYPDTA